MPKFNNSSINTRKNIYIWAKYYKKMKILCSENTTPLEEMLLTKMRLHVNGNDTENIWVRRDGTKIYLQNHALAFYPYPSWGAEFSNNLNMHEYVKDGPDQTVLTVHPEAYEHIKSALSEDGTLDLEKFNNLGLEQEDQE